MKKLLLSLFLLFCLNIGISTSGSTNLDNYTYEREFQIERLKSIIEEKGQVAYLNWDSIPIYSPVEIRQLKRMSSDYGLRKHPIFKVYLKHRGVDFVALKDANVRSTADGVVVKIKYSRIGYGNQVVVKHSNGYKTRYAHLKSINVKKGEKVKAKQSIATLGSSGLTTGPHLHYEILKDDFAIDPLGFTFSDSENRSIVGYYKHLIALEKSNAW